MKIKMTPTAGLIMLAIVLGIIAWLHGMLITSFREYHIGMSLVATIPDSFLFGLIVGSINPRRWLLAGVTAWLNAVLGIFVLVDIIEVGQVTTADVRDLLSLSLLPLGLAFLGGYVSTILVNKLSRRQVLVGTISLATFILFTSHLLLSC